jgi:hypothetical protein
MQGEIKEQENNQSTTTACQTVSTVPDKFCNMLNKKPLCQAKTTTQLLFKETDEVFQKNLVRGSEGGGRRLETATFISAALNEVRNTAGESDDDNDAIGDFDEEYYQHEQGQEDEEEEDDDDQSASSVLLAEVFQETFKQAIELTDDSGMTMPSLASIGQESFLNGGTSTNDMSFLGSSVVSSLGASFAVGHKSACFGAPDLDPITETMEKIVITDGRSDPKSHHRPPRRSSIQLDELQPRWDNKSPDHSKQGCQRWDTSDNSFKKDSVPTIIRR